MNHTNLPNQNRPLFASLASWLKPIMLAVWMLLSMTILINPAHAQTTQWQTLDGKKPIIIAHRGASGYMPDHTLQGYEKAVQLGADFIEPDLVSTKDGVLIVRHEPNLKDTTDIAKHPEFAHLFRKAKVDEHEEEGWFASDLTLAQIKTLRAKQPRADRSTEYNGKFEIPTFDEVLTLREQLSQKHGRVIGVYPETKHATWHQSLNLPLEQKIVDALVKHNMNQKNAPIFIQSFELTNLKQLRKMTTVPLVYLIDGDAVNPDGSIKTTRPYDFVVKNDLRTYADMLQPKNLQEIAQVAQGIGPWKVYLASYRTDSDGSTHRLPMNDVIKNAHAAGLKVHPFTFRNEAKHLTTDDNNDPYPEYAAFFKAGVDGLFSDYTDTAVQARKRFESTNAF
ncbi:MAG: glpQ [Burkholderiaceae bacterium]|nr:glpQ [Burkholderiaceae bacterium]